MHASRLGEHQAAYAKTTLEDGHGCHHVAPGGHCGEDDYRGDSETTEPKGRDTGQADAKEAKATKPTKPKRISGVTAAFMVLADAGKELGVKKIVEIAGEKGWWKSTAATPQATVYAAIIREIGTKADKSRFQRGKRRGTFRAVCSPERKLELLGKQA